MPTPFPRNVLCAAVLLVPCAIAGAQNASLPVPANVRVDGIPPIPMSLVDGVAPYAEFRQARMLAWHPRERRMLIQTSFGNVPQIHEVREPGGARTQLTFYRDGVSGLAAYDPQARCFVFQKDVGEGAESLQFFRYDPSSGAITRLTAGSAINDRPVWSHRRGLMAYDSNRRDGKSQDLYVMDPMKPDSDRLVAQLEGGWSVLDWSPDDRELLAVEVVSAASESYLWRIDVDTGRKIAVTSRGLHPVLWRAARFSPDGKSVYALTNRDSEVLRLWRGNLATGAWTSVTPAGEPIELFALSPDGTSIALVVDRGATSQLQLIDAVSGQPRALPTLAPGVISSLAWHSNGADLAFTYAGARTFNDVYSVDVRRGTLARWTTSEMGGANPESLPDAEIVHWKSFDGLPISAVLYRPPARFTGPRPVIINIHGGPADRQRPRSLGRSNYFRNELGIAIIYPNVRGSAGYGKTFEQLDNGPKREDAVKDIGSLLDWIAAQPSLDRNRVMVTGSSYGGYLTLAAAIAYGDRIRCAFEGFGISDFVAYLESTEESRRQDRRIEYGDPSDPKMRDFLQKISPIANVSRLKVPLFIAQGASDTRVPLSQAEAMVKAVKNNGTPLWYVVYGDAGHEQLSKVMNDFNTYAWVLFVESYLLK